MAKLIGTKVFIKYKVERRRYSASNKMTPSYRILSCNAIKNSKGSSYSKEIVLEIIIIIVIYTVKYKIAKWRRSMKFIKYRF